MDAPRAEEKNNNQKLPSRERGLCNHGLKYQVMPSWFNSDILMMTLREITFHKQIAIFRVREGDIPEKTSKVMSRLSDF